MFLLGEKKFGAFLHFLYVCLRPSQIHNYCRIPRAYPISIRKLLFGGESYYSIFLKFMPSTLKCRPLKCHRLFRPKISKVRFQVLLLKFHRCQII